MRAPDTVAIVGAGLAGAHAALALRQAGHAGEILLIGQEPLAPYERPPLSKDVLAQPAEPAPPWIRPFEDYAAQRITLVLGQPVVAIQRENAPQPMALRLADGRQLRADAVLLATGGRARRLPEAEALSAVHTLRDWDDALRLRAALQPGARVAVVGTGFIGAEVAATAAALGCVVEAIEAAAQPFGAVACPEVRGQLLQAHARAGVRFHLRAAIQKIRQRTGGGATIALANGAVLQADVLVVGIGMQPNAELAEAAGARVARGVVVNERYESSVPGLYAAGDAACLPGDDGVPRCIEHWRSAMEQGAGAALAILGRPPPARSVPWAWSDQLGLRLEIAGHPRPTDARVLRRADEQSLACFHLRDGLLVGVTALNAPRLVRAASKLMAAGARPDPVQLADARLPLDQVARLAPKIADHGH